jgi:hypothetical protein
MSQISTSKLDRRRIALLRIAIALLIMATATAMLAQTMRANKRSVKRHIARALPGTSADPLLFLPAVAYDSGGEAAESVAVADVNGDGKPDLIVANGTNNVGVLLGNGDGTFQPAVNYSSGGTGPSSVAVADVNHDHRPDIVVANASNSVGVLLGNGDGTFQAAVLYSSGGSTANSVSIADVNGDGRPDLIVANNFDHTLGVLLGRGNGTFKPAVAYDSGGLFVWSAAVADVNGDGKRDLLAVNFDSGTVGVLLGNGNGTFQTAVPYSVGPAPENPQSVAAADVNADGKIDLIVANGDNLVAVLLGNGDGTFQTAVTYFAPGGRTTWVAVADVNEDGKPDLLVANAGGGNNFDGSVGVLLGNGDGTFQATEVYDSGGNGGPDGSVFVADVNGDGKPDLLVTNECVGCSEGTHSTVAVLLNNSGAAPTTTSLKASPNPAAFNQVVTYTATVTSSSGGAVNGTVMFLDGNATIGTVTIADNQAVLTASYKTISSHVITATYSGELHIAAGSISNSVTEDIRAASKTVVTSSGSPSRMGQAVTFTATISSRFGRIPDGESVTFLDGTKMLGSRATAGGIATFTTSSLSVGTHTIRAKYAGDKQFRPSAGTVTQVVQP